MGENIPHPHDGPPRDRIVLCPKSIRQILCKLSDLEDGHRDRISIDEALSFTEKECGILPKMTMGLLDLSAVTEHFKNDRPVSVGHTAAPRPFWPSQSAPHRLMYR